MYKNFLYGFCITIIVILTSFGYIIFKTFPPNFFQVLMGLNKKYLISSFIFLIFYHTFDNLRLFFIARSLNLRYPFLYGYLVSLVSTFGATVTPAHLGGEVLPLYTLSRKGGEFYKILTAVTIKGVSGTLFYVFFLPFTLHTLFKNPKQTKEFLVIVFLLIFLFVLGYLLWQKLVIKNESLLKGKLRKKLKNTFLKYIATCKQFIKKDKKVFLTVLIFSFLLYFSFIFIGIFLLKAFHVNINWKEVYLNQLPLVYAIFMSPTPGGSGVGELGALPIFSSYLSETYLGIFVILWRIISQYLSAFLGGIIFSIFLLKDLRKN
ncbi:MAG: flippase-like domain-containing protein [Thermodesulfobacteriaceae bacterium]|nr:flippase-like domain-containing protein [Thermodesulfobacteriaceae bacterium]MCX8041274.1 flippase-like domain-containing protein [Thermodesulfobacteriaceae bacterium]MDW8135433.1 flippase-like domain-containing protein [Thermodesulfobacterium sp.]